MHGLTKFKILNIFYNFEWLLNNEDTLEGMCVQTSYDKVTPVNVGLLVGRRRKNNNKWYT